VSRLLPFSLFLSHFSNLSLLPFTPLETLFFSNRKPKVSEAKSGPEEVKEYKKLKREHEGERIE